MLHPDIASIDPKTATPEDLEKLLSDPLYRSLQYQIQHGVQNIELETNQGKQKINNICVPEGEDQEAFLQKVMAEENRNKERKTKEEARKKEKEKQERLKKSDPYELIIEGAGLEKVNGTYRRDGEAVRNGGRVFKGPNGFSLSFECVSGGEGWILGKTPRAYYANQTKDKVCERASAHTHATSPAPPRPPSPALARSPSARAPHEPTWRRGAWYGAGAAHRAGGMDGAGARQEAGADGVRGRAIGRGDAHQGRRERRLQGGKPSAGD